MSFSNNAVETVISRAAVDADFRRLLVDSPAEAISQATGIQLPEHVTLKFVEKEKGVDAMFVLPDYVNVEAELSAEELEAVAGGVSETEELAWCDNVCFSITTGGVTF